YSFAFVVMPGGFGTMDEFFEALTLIQTKKIRNFPVIIFGKDYNEDLLGYIDQMKKCGTIGPEDHKLFLTTDNVTEAVNLIKERSIRAYDLKPQKSRMPLFWLFEKS